MGYVRTDDGARIHYEVYGAGEKTILFVHGYLDDGSGFARISGALQKQYRVVVFDHRAHGASDTPPDGYTMTQLARDMKRLIHTLGLGQVIAVGYSMGVHVIYRYIELFGTGDFEKVVLSVMSPRLLTDDGYRLGLGGNTTPADALELVVLANRSMEEYVLRDLREDMPEAAKQAIRANAKRVSTELAHGPMLRLLIAMFEHDFWPMLGAIDCPALVIAGERDIYPRETQEAVSARIPGAKLVILEGCGHLMMYERPDAYIREIAGFIG